MNRDAVVPGGASFPVSQVTVATSELLGLLRAGEQSALATFSRIARRITDAAEMRARGIVEGLAGEEAYHDQLLSRAATFHGVLTARPAAEVRQFFLRLESRDLGVHLARVASLDSCVCQVLACVVSGHPGTLLPNRLAHVLQQIRRDEGRHVRVVRGLALDLGVSSGTLDAQNDETRRAFDRVVLHYETAFRGLGVDFDEMRRRIARNVQR